jgi:hypothetical protein
MIRVLRRYSAELSVLVIGAGLRLLLLAPSYVPAQLDEVHYAADGLLLLEGVTLGFKFAPGAITTWLGFVYGFAVWFFKTVSEIGSVIELDSTVVPLVTLDQTLFDIYADMAGLRAVIVATVVLISLLGVYGAARIGRHFGDWPGALFTGGLAAVLPLFCLFAVQSRPYSPAWSLTILAMSIMLTCGGSRRWVWAGIVYGLAVASRIEMLFTIPLILWLMWIISDEDSSVRSGTRMAAAAILTFLVSAPWFFGHLVGNVRKMLTVVVVRPRVSDTGPIIDFLTQQGLTIVTVVTLLGVLLLCRTERWKAWLALAYLSLLGVELLTLETSGGLRHVGHVFVVLVVLGGYALGGVQHAVGKPWAIRVSATVTLLALALPLMRTVSMAREIRSGWVEHHAVDWIEANITAGSRVFLTRRNIRVPLPTEASADRLWGAAAHETAWREKLERRLTEIDVELEYLPRGLSMEHMYQELSGLRRYFILGSAREKSRPRYELRLVQVGEETQDFRDALSEFQRDGGVFWHSGQPLDSSLGPPEKAWIASNGTGVFLYTRVENRAGSR